jgi:hypothetical protein
MPLAFLALIFRLRIWNSYIHTQKIVYRLNWSKFCESSNLPAAKCDLHLAGFISNMWTTKK